MLESELKSRVLICAYLYLVFIIAYPDHKITVKITFRERRKYVRRSVSEAFEEL
jgi:hypothetical protein